jgi:cytochrome c biogenesis protein CcmG, thiol:disulfide interchange protein DsbE
MTPISDIGFRTSRPGAAAFAALVLLVLSAPPAGAADSTRLAGDVDAKGLAAAVAKDQGKVVVVNFWATWCVPCRDELPLLSQYALAHAGSGLKVLGFTLDTPETMIQVRKVAQTLSFPVGLASQSSAPGYGRIWRLPVNFTIDRAGQLRDNGWKARNPGWTAERLEQIVTPLLATGEGP